MKSDCFRRVLTRSTKRPSQEAFFITLLSKKRKKSKEFSICGVGLLPQDFDRRRKALFARGSFLSPFLLVEKRVIIFILPAFFTPMDRFKPVEPMPPRNLRLTNANECVILPRYCDAAPLWKKCRGYNLTRID